MEQILCPGCGKPMEFEGEWCFGGYKKWCAWPVCHECGWKGPEGWSDVSEERARKDASRKASQRCSQSPLTAEEILNFDSECVENPEVLFIELRGLFLIRCMQIADIRGQKVCFEVFGDKNLFSYDLSDLNSSWRAWKCPPSSGDRNTAPWEV